MNKNVAQWLVAQWIARFGEILLTMGDLKASMHVEHLDDSAIKDGLLWWEQSFSCTPDSPVWTGAPEDAWTEIGKVVLAGAGVDSGPISEVQSTYMELVRQSMGSLAQDIGQRISNEVVTDKGAETPPRKIGRQIFSVEVELPSCSVFLTMIIADALCDSILALEKASVEPASTQLQRQERQEPQEQSPAAGAASRTFELLLDVEMPVSVSFGRATLTLREALKLITGSLIELDRGLNDPVELLVNNCVIARGEVVVVEGNYGVRITEIISQKERLQQTRRYMLQ
jgi:flagellar motor switch protein FliN/FliY